MQMQSLGLSKHLSLIKGFAKVMISFLLLLHQHHLLLLVCPLLCYMTLHRLLRICVFFVSRAFQSVLLCGMPFTRQDFLQCAWHAYVLFVVKGVLQLA